MRTTIELSDTTYRRLRAVAADRGLRGFSPIVEEAVRALLDNDREGRAPSALAGAEGAWSEADVEDWERAREEAWSTWRADLSSTPMS